MSEANIRFIAELETIVQQRIRDNDAGSYTASLVAGGRQRVAQKVGEEALELAIATAAGDRKAELDEAADLVFHLLVLLASRDIALAEVAARLEERHQKIN